MFEKLSEGLRQGFQKIARAVLVDRTLIDAVVKDFQRALLAADADVSLVQQLSERIRKRSLEEKPPGLMTEREHLTKILYDELSSFFGGEQQAFEVGKKKPFVILLVGLYGNGKCVHPDSNIILGSGEVLPIKNLYARFSHLPSEKVEEGDVIDVSSQNLFVPSFNPRTMKIEEKPVTHIWRLSGKELMNVSLDNGNNFAVRVTPEHPFFVLHGGNFMMVRADQLTEDDYVAIPRVYPHLHQELVDFFPQLQKLDLDIFLDSASCALIRKNSSLKKLVSCLQFSRNYCVVSHNLKQYSYCPIQFVPSYQGPVVRIKLKEAVKPIFFPRFISEDLAEFLGYVFGDGHLEKNYVEITNQDQEIVQRFISLSNTLFGICAKKERDTRRRTLYRVRICSSTLVQLLNSVFGIPIGKKGRHLQIPAIIHSSSNDTVARFLRAYFDCDGSVSRSQRQIEVTSESETMIKHTASLLLRFGILSIISSKQVSGDSYYRLIISARHAESYANLIGFSVFHKAKRLKNFYPMGLIQGSGKHDMIPVAKSLQNLRESLGFSIGQIQCEVPSYSRYESMGYISREKLIKTLAYCGSRKGNVLSMLEHLENPHSFFDQSFINALTSHLVQQGFVVSTGGSILLTQEGKSYLQKIKSAQSNSLMRFMKNLANSDVGWSRVRSIRNTPNDSLFVYDLTIQDNHSFIADNIVVHNTTSAAKLAKYFGKRGHKVCTVGLDVHRAAAPLQLQMNSEKAGVECFIDDKEKSPKKIWEKFKDQFKKFDVVIVDTAGRDALSKELISELKDVASFSKPDETLLVMGAEIGQAARFQAEELHKGCGITGVILTKLDGTAKGGGALTACSVTKAKVRFVGTGEKVDDLEVFQPVRFVSRMLGLGDLQGLLEKAREVIDQKKAEDTASKIMSGKFGLLELYEQMESIKQMGPLTKVMEMVPGLGGKVPKELMEVQEGKLKKWKFVMDSMTKEELENPDTIDGKRVSRISQGAGVSTGDVRELLKQYQTGKKLMKQMGGKNMEKMMKRLGIGM